MGGDGDYWYGCDWKVAAMQYLPWELAFLGFMGIILAVDPKIPWSYYFCAVGFLWCFYAITKSYMVWLYQGTQIAVYHDKVVVRIAWPTGVENTVVFLNKVQEVSFTEHDATHTTLMLKHRDHHFGGLKTTHLGPAEFPYALVKDIVATVAANQEGQEKKEQQQQGVPKQKRLERLAQELLKTLQEE
jgi:hypothetical protein